MEGDLRKSTVMMGIGFRAQGARRVLAADPSSTSCGFGSLTLYRSLRAVSGVRCLGGLNLDGWRVSVAASAFFMFASDANQNKPNPFHS